MLIDDVLIYLLQDELLLDDDSVRFNTGKYCVRREGENKPANSEGKLGSNAQVEMIWDPQH